MKIKDIGNEMLEVTTEVYQSKSGALYLNWGAGLSIRLNRRQAEVIADDLPGIDREQFKVYYDMICRP